MTKVVHWSSVISH